jgi:extradiol dioxygenase family protein
MKRLDKSRPFGEVFGMARVCFAQDGAYFDFDGREVVDEAGKAPDTEPGNPVTREDLEKLHWTKLRARLNGLDIEYTSREEAIEAILSHG